MAVRCFVCFSELLLFIIIRRSILSLSFCICCRSVKRRRKYPSSLHYSRELPSFLLSDPPGRQQPFRAEIYEFFLLFSDFYALFIKGSLFFPVFTHIPKFSSINYTTHTTILHPRASRGVCRELPLAFLHSVLAFRLMLVALFVYFMEYFVHA